MRQTFLYNNKFVYVGKECIKRFISVAYQGSLSASFPTSLCHGITFSRSLSTFSEDRFDEFNKERFLHISPAGDTWIGDKIFAAKHLQSGYIRSIQINELDLEVEEYIEEYCNGLSRADLEAIYDTGKVPDEILDIMSKHNKRDK